MRERDAGAVRGARGLHQCRQVDAVPRADRRARLRRRPAVRDPRSDRAAHRSCPAAPRWCSPTRSASSASCRTSSSPRSSRRSPRRATATLLLHVVDASDPRRDERSSRSNAVLDEIGAAQIPQLSSTTRSTAWRARRVSSVTPTAGAARCGSPRRAAPASICCARRWPSVWRAVRAARACAARQCRRAALAPLRRPCRARRANRRGWRARTRRGTARPGTSRPGAHRGVQILEVARPAQTPCAPEGLYLQSLRASSSASK